MPSISEDEAGWGDNVVVVPAKVADAALLAGRRQQIVSTATGVMLEKGFHRTSIRDIAAAADITMGTLYLYISRKEDVLYLIASAIMEDLSDGLLAVKPRGTALDTLHAAAEHFFNAVAGLRREVALLYRESASMLPEHLEVLKQSELRERDFLADIIRSGIDRGEFRPVNPELVAHNIIMLAHMWTLKGWTLKDTFDVSSYFRAQFDLILADVLPERREGLLAS